MKFAATLILATLCIGACVQPADGRSRAAPGTSGKQATPRAPAVAKPVAPPSITVAPDSVEGRLLAAHNAERQRLGLQPLTWNPTLAAQALVWAQELATKDEFEHSKNRDGAGENLWMGTAGDYTPESMVQDFVDEKQYFRAGKFPDISTTGQWVDVGHYTQLIWPRTRELGCAIATAHDNDVLVCRYLPAGNVVGAQVP